MPVILSANSAMAYAALSTEYYILEYLQDSRILEPIKPAKVLTISNDLSQKCFEKRSHYFEITGRSFRNQSWK